MSDCPDGRSETSSTDAELWEPTGDCAKLLLDQEIVVPVIGAGFSSACGLPDTAKFRSALVEALQSEAGAFSEVADLRTVADEYVQNDPERSNRLRHWVANYWRAELKRVNPSDLARALLGIPSRLIVTLNYDSLLEKTAAAASVRCERLDDIYQISDIESLLQTDSPPDRLTIVHLHGSERDPRTIALDRIGYRDVGDAVRRLYQLLAARRRLCYLGTSLDEAHIIDTLHRSIGHGQTHPLFVDSETDQKMRDRAPLSEATHGVRPCVLPSRNHLRGVVRHLTRPRAEPVHAQSEVSAALTVPPEYVATVLATGGDADESRIDIEAQLSIEGGWDWHADSETTFLTEEELVAGSRNIVLGAPGSGKTELLRYASQVLPPQQTLILIRLIDVPPNVADPSTRLMRWMKRGITTKAGIGLTKESIEGKSLHLLLDGLDEVTPAFQERLARQIEAIADSFPQHSITLTSRPIEAVALLGGGWRFVSLQPGTVWQRRYLEHRNVDLGELVDQLTNGRDLIDLLKLPFFLTRVIDLNERGVLAGLDLWGVVQKLVELALTAEDARELLPVRPNVAREWLRNAALAMQLAGRTMLSIAEIEEVPLPTGAAAEKQEICEALVQRAMLQRRSEGYGFVHRIIGEALAAEALAALEPTDGLLASIVPVRDDAVRGVRADWRVSMSFLASTSADWRASLKESRPIQCGKSRNGWWTSGDSMHYVLSRRKGARWRKPCAPS